MSFTFESNNKLRMVAKIQGGKYNNKIVSLSDTYIDHTRPNFYNSSNYYLLTRSSFFQPLL